MEKKLLRRLIREDNTGDVNQVLKEVKLTDVSVIKHKIGYYNYMYKGKSDATEFHTWALQKGYITSEKGNVYQLKTPGATLTVDNGDCTIHELVDYGNMYSRINLSNVDIARFETFVENLPNLLKGIEEDAAFVRDNYEKIRRSEKKKNKHASFNQSIIEARVVERLSDRYNYKIKKNKIRLTVSVEAGGYWLDYPINNSKADNMTAVLDDLEKAVAAINELPYGTKLRKR